MMKFHKKLEKIIFDAGYKNRLGKLAIEIGMSTENSSNPSSLLTQYITGGKPVSINNLKRIAKFFKLSPVDLIEDTDYPKHKILEEETLRYKKIPIIDWYKIFPIKKQPKLLTHKSGILNITYKYEKNLFATIIPKKMMLDIYPSLFNPNDYLLISPEKPPINGCPIILRKDNWLEPEYVIYSQFGSQKGYRYPGEKRARRLSSDFLICGVIVARISDYIPEESVDPSGI